MEKEILLPAKQKGKLEKVFNTSRQTVWGALTYKNDNPLARKIRHVALKEYGGRFYTDLEGFVPECVTTFQENEQTMTQFFGDRVKLIYYKKTNQLGFFVDNSLKTVYNNPTLDEFTKIQMEAQRLIL